MKNRDILWLIFCLSLALGEAVGFAFSNLGSSWPFVAAITFLFIIFAFSFRLRYWICIALFLTGITLALETSAEKNKILNEALEEFGGSAYTTEATITGVANVKSSSNGVQRVTVPASIGPVDIKVFYETTEEIPRIGERWQFTGFLSRTPLPNRDVRMFWVKGSNAVRLPGTFFGWLTGLVANIRADLSRRAGIGLEHNPLGASLNRAILLGERAAMDASVKNDFASAGTIHLFAISGLHIMFIAYLLRFLLVIGGVPLRFVGTVLIPLLWLYAWITGFPPSAVRATIMASFYYSAPIFWRRPNGMVSWALTFLIIHLISPIKLFDVGCRLSFVVMLSIVVWMNWGCKFKNKVVNVMSFTSIAWAAGVPMTARIFERFTIGGILANPILIPVAAFCVTSAVLGCFASFISDIVASHLNNLAALCTFLMAEVSRFVANIPGASTEIAPWSLVMCILWYLAIIFVIYLAHKKQVRNETNGWLS